MTPTIKDQLQIETAPGDDFIEFLRFCADRLNKDEPVQAIWIAWKELTAQKQHLFLLTRSPSGGRAFLFALFLQADMKQEHEDNQQ